MRDRHSIKKSENAYPSNVWVAIVEAFECLRDTRLIKNTPGGCEDDLQGQARPKQQLDKTISSGERTAYLKRWLVRGDCGEVVVPDPP